MDFGVPAYPARMHAMNPPLQETTTRFGDIAVIDVAPAVAPAGALGDSVQNRLRGRPVKSGDELSIEEALSILNRERSLARMPLLDSLPNTMQALELVNSQRDSRNLPPLNRVPGYSAPPIVSLGGENAVNFGGISLPLMAQGEPTALENKAEEARRRAALRNRGKASSPEEPPVYEVRKTEAELRRENCERMVASITPEQRTDAAFMYNFATSNPDCAPLVPGATLCKLDEVPQSFPSETERAAFIARRPACATIASARPIVSAVKGCTAALPAYFGRSSEKQSFLQANPSCADEINAIPTCDAVPNSFETEAAKQAFIVANPACAELARSKSVTPVIVECPSELPHRFADEAAMQSYKSRYPGCDVSAVPIGRDWTPYYIVGGISAAVLLAGTAAYFALRTPSEDADG